MNFSTRNLPASLAISALCAMPALAATHHKAIKPSPGAELGTPTTLYTFPGTTEHATGNLMQARDGNFYGVTTTGQAGGTGTLYSLTPGGVYTALQTFSSEVPAGSVVQGLDGNLYGLLTDNTFSGSGALFVYNIARNQILSTTSLGSNGGESLTQDSQGNLYGVTETGGANAEGSVFKVTINVNPGGTYPPPAPTVTTIASFSEGTDATDTGINPDGTPVAASDGYLYGASAAGTFNQSGVVWKLNPSAPVLTVVGTFSSLGVQNPAGGLTEASDDNVYGYVDYTGTAVAGLYQVSLSAGTLKLFHTYSSADENEQIFTGTPLVTATGDVVTAGSGGAFAAGTITDVNIQDTTGNTTADLYDFTDGTDGGLPYATPSAGAFGNTDGVLIGTTYISNSNTEGSVIYGFEGFGMPVITLTTSTTTVQAGTAIVLNWAGTNAFSQSAQTCYANSSDFTFTGKITPSGTMSVTPIHPGGKQYSITCGGVESAVLAVTVTNGTIDLTDSNGNALTTGSYDFGAPYIAPPNYTKPTRTIRLVNNTVTAYPFTLTQTAADAFNFPYTTTCPASVAPGGSCTITFQFSPQGNGNYSNTYTLAKQGFLFSPGNTGTLTGRGAYNGSITLNATYHNFGTVATGSITSYTFTLANGTNMAEPFTVTPMQVKGTMGNSSYSTTCPSPIPAGTVCTLTYNIDVPTAGSYEVLLDVPQSSFVQPNIPIYATAVNQN